MTWLLGSVRDAEEARIAVAGGVDIVDLKEPAQGALGAVAPSTVAACLAAVNGARPVSAVTGDLPMVPEQLTAAAEAMAAAGVDFVKVGLFADPRRNACVAALQQVAAKTRLIGVMFADAGYDPALVALLATSGFAGAMIDTADKAAGPLTAHLPVAALRGFVEACHCHGLLAGLAGSLTIADVPSLLPLSPDFVGFRGALCCGRRGDRVDPTAIRALRALFDAPPAIERTRPRQTMAI